MAEMRTIPQWFIWTTTIGLGAILVLLALNYLALTANTRTTYAMAQGAADVGLMNSGMMRMMAQSMVRNGMMTEEEFDLIHTGSDSARQASDAMEQMMRDGAVSPEESRLREQTHEKMHESMEQMMR